VNAPKISPDAIARMNAIAASTRAAEQRAEARALAIKMFLEHGGDAGSAAGYFDAAHEFLEALNAQVAKKAGRP